MEDTYPNFSSGDVLIIIAPDMQYTLHRHTLMRVSPTLRSLLADHRTIKLSKKALRLGEKLTNRVIAVENADVGGEEPDGNGESPVLLEAVLLDEMGLSVHVHSLGIDLKRDDEFRLTCLAYERVFAAIYNRPISFTEFEKEFDEETKPKAIIKMARHVTQVAEYLDCVEIITKPVEAAVFATGQLLYRSMAAEPYSWAEFGARIHSVQIFRQAVIFAAGQYNTREMREALPKLRPDVRALIEKKADLIKVGVMRAQSMILSYYPREIQREMSVGLVHRDNTSRSSYSNDILSWIALTIFRHWATQHVVADHTHHAEDMGFAFLKCIQDAGDAYLDKSTLVDFHRLFPMSTKGAAVVENKILGIKEHVKKFVDGFFKNNTALNIERHPIGFFLHVDVQYEELPWVRERAEAARKAPKESEKAEDMEME